MQKTALIILIILLLWVIVNILPAITLAENMENCNYNVTTIFKDASASKDLVYYTLQNVPEEKVINEKMAGYAIIKLTTNNKQEAQAQYAQLKSIPNVQVLFEVYGDINNESNINKLFASFSTQALQGTNICTIPCSQSALRIDTDKSLAEVGYPYLLNLY